MTKYLSIKNVNGIKSHYYYYYDNNSIRVHNTRHFDS